ncbi:MAG: nucleotide exchange factor GrpE [Sphingobacterium sp.]
MKNENENIQDPELNPEEEQEIQESTEVDELTQKLAESNDKYTRLFAEFDNYKRRTSKERIELMQSAGKDVIVKLLPIIDDFDRAIQFMDEIPEDDPVKKGLDLVYQKLTKTFEQFGVKEIEVMGEAFDAEFQEAITLIPAPTPEMKDKVIDVVEKGYLLNNNVIRFAKVVVGQ